MGVFDDKTYEDMDFVSQLCEPVFNPLDEKLAQLPDEFIINDDNVFDFVEGGYRGLRTIDFDLIFNKLTESITIDYGSKSELKSCFDIEIQVDDDAVLDVEERTSKGIFIRVFKIKERFDEKETLSKLGREGLSKLNHAVYCWHQMDKGRVNEMLELLGLDEARRFRSVRKKIGSLYNELKKIMEENRWNLRDIELSNKVCKWIYLYMRDNNGAALVNFCKLKAMTHQTDAPIYSIEEEQV